MGASLHMRRACFTFANVDQRRSCSSRGFGTPRPRGRRGQRIHTLSLSLFWLFLVEEGKGEQIRNGTKQWKLWPPILYKYPPTIKLVLSYKMAERDGGKKLEHVQKIKRWMVFGSFIYRPGFTVFLEHHVGYSPKKVEKICAKSLQTHRLKREEPEKSGSVTPGRKWISRKREPTGVKLVTNPLSGLIRG